MRIVLSVMMIAALVAPAVAKDFNLIMPCDVYLEARRAGILPYVDDPVLAYTEDKKIIGFGYICTIADYATELCATHPHYSVKQALDEVDGMYRADQLPPIPACSAEILHLPRIPLLP